eukprot:364942-Chlamydomonas_euryale.AAC.7
MTAKAERPFVPSVHCTARRMVHVDPGESCALAYAHVHMAPTPPCTCDAPHVLALGEDAAPSAAPHRAALTRRGHIA